MSIQFTLLSSAPYLEFPKDLAGRFLFVLAWFSFVGIILALLWLWRAYGRKQDSRFWGMFFTLVFLAPIASLFFGLRLPAVGALPPPGVPVEPEGPALMVFSFIPWIFAAGLLGPLPAAGVAAFSGLFTAIWDTHNPLTPLEFALMAVLFGVAVHQRYRTIFFRLLRQPFVMAIILCFVYLLIFFLTSSLVVSGSLASRLDYTLTHSRMASIAVGSELLIAAAFAQVVAIALPSIWGSRGLLLPAPTELSLRARFINTMLPLVFVLAISLVVSAWNVAERTARKMISDRLSNVAQVSAEITPYFLEAGQNLITQLADDERFNTIDSSGLVEVLKEDLRTVPFFNQLFLLDTSQDTLAGFPVPDYRAANGSVDEQNGIQLALQGVPFQIYSVAPLEGHVAAQVSFLAAVNDTNGLVRGVLVGRADLATNPFSQPIINSLRSVSDSGSESMLLDENDVILYHSIPELVMTKYTGLKTETPMLFDVTGSEGTRYLTYYQKAEGRPWAVVVRVPAQQAQQLALEIAGPLFGMVLVLFTVAAFILLFYLRKVTGSLETFADQAAGIAEGQLDRPLQVVGEDELGRLRHAFEKMRLGLKARLDESSRLLWVSQGVASSLEISKAVHPVLESALVTGACSVRLVLAPDVLPVLGENSLQPLSYALGQSADLYAALDEQILSLTQEQDRIVLTNLSRPRLIRIEPGTPVPEALMGVAIRHENHYYGALWLAFDGPHSFSEEEVRFFATLASQAALAAANARHFLNAEIGRKRLDAILSSTPDPILVTDQMKRLLLANPAAWKAIGIGADWEERRPIEEVILQKELVDLLLSSSDEHQPSEVTLTDGKVYSAITSTVIAEGQPVGRVCILRDVTYFKDVDALKSEFVATVSHDLRNPLTLMRGYATMLEMVGELNEQQVSYVHKIGGAVESMTRLVNNLLDLGRIDAGIGLKLELVSVRDILDRVVSGFQLQATQRRIQLTLDLPGHTIPLIEADQALLQQAFQNLVENAIKFTDAGGKVVVSVKTQPNRMVFEVRDTGIGIAPVDQAHLFEKFHPSSQSSAKPSSGSGLGLAIVKSIAERHGGQVWADSQLGRGSTFFLVIPMRQPKSESEIQGKLF